MNEMKKIHTIDNNKKNISREDQDLVEGHFC